MRFGFTENFKDLLEGEGSENYHVPCLLDFLTEDTAFTKTKDPFEALGRDSEGGECACAFEKSTLL